MLRYRLSSAAQADVVDILAWTHGQFGEAARLRYESLIVAALCRFEPTLLVVGRMLHEAMELARHLDPDRSWE
jgi:toxin ParE1/3/4